jgi:hypothetical protein
MIRACSVRLSLEVLNGLNVPYRTSKPWGSPKGAISLPEAASQSLTGAFIVGQMRPGRRSGAWVKVKLTLEQEFVIGGYTPPEGSRKYFGSAGRLL